MTDQIDNMKRKASRIVGDGMLMRLTVPSLGINELVEVRQEMDAFQQRIFKALYVPERYLRGRRL